jgi:hypothetical protein
MKTIGILASIQGEDENYIVEWIDYHMALGVTHFYIYDESNKNCLHFLKNRYTSNVFIYHKPLSKNIENYNNFFENVNNNNISDFWIAIINCNQYIALHEHNNIIECMNYLEFYKGSLVINTKTFGSNGKLHKENYPTVERFTKCSATHNESIKSIVVLNNIESKKNKYIENNDIVNLKYPFYHRDQWNNTVQGNKVKYNNTKCQYCKTLTNCIIQINTYETKSHEEWKRFIENDQYKQYSFNYVHIVDKFANEVDDYTACNFSKKHLKATSTTLVDEIGVQTYCSMESKEIQVQPLNREFSIQTDHVLSRNKSSQTDVEIARSINSNKSAQTDDHWTHHIIELLQEIVSNRPPIPIDETKPGINAIMILNMTKNLGNTERSFLLQQMGISEKEFQKTIDTLSHIPQEHVNSMIEKYKTKHNK